MAADFFSRWSARKQQARAGQPVVEPPSPAAGAAGAPSDPASPLPVPAAIGHPLAAPGVGQATDRSDPAPASVGVPVAAQAPAPPTLEQAQQLTLQSDFSPFVARGVAADVRNLALKKLFADPHFNVMDRLDTYIDDYSIADPLPPGMLGQLAGAQFLNLVQPDAAAPAAPPVTADGVLRDDASTAAEPAVPESGLAAPVSAGPPGDAAPGLGRPATPDPDHEPDTRPPHERA